MEDSDFGCLEIFSSQVFFQSFVISEGRDGHGHSGLAEMYQSIFFHGALTALFASADEFVHCGILPEP